MKMFALCQQMVRKYHRQQYQPSPDIDRHTNTDNLKLYVPLCSSLDQSAQSYTLTQGSKWSPRNFKFFTKPIDIYNTILFHIFY